MSSSVSGRLRRRSLQVFYQNVRGLNTKTHQFLNFTWENSTLFDVITCSETWLNESVLDSELFSSEYTVFRADRRSGSSHRVRGGGVAIAVRSDISCVRMNIQKMCSVSVDLGTIDVVGVRLTFDNTSIIIITTYIPPTTPLEYYLSFFELLEVFSLKHNARLLLIGDFNITEFVDTISTTRMTAFQNMCSILNITQYNSVKNSNSRLLDLILYSGVCKVEKSQSMAVSEDAHHPALHIVLDDLLSERKTSALRGNMSHSSYDYRKANLFNLYDAIAGAEWDRVKNLNDPSTALAAFYDVIYPILDTCVPKTSPIKRANFPPWFTPVIKAALKKKMHYWKLYKNSLNPEFYDKFAELRTSTKKDINESYRNYVANLENQISTNSRKFWAFINAKNRTAGLPCEMRFRGVSVSHPQDIVDGFADYFAGFVGARESSPNLPPEVESLSVNTLHISGFSLDDLRNATRAIRPNLTSGPDGIPGFLIRDCFTVLAEPLLHIFNLMFTTCVFPETWKISRGTPLFKSGDKQVGENYRIIAIQDNLAKLWEACMSSYISFHFKSLVAPEQHGFVKGRSTATNLASITQYIANTLEHRSQVDVIYLDFSKAFDRMNHSLLLSRLRGIGLSENLVALIRSYLDNRQIYIQVKGHRSRSFSALTGVPQGSLLGPLFFNIFVNTIVSGLGVPCLLYADDVKLFSVVNDVSHARQLQDALNTVIEWSQSNHLPLNVEKCSVMSYYRIKDPLRYDYGIDGFILQRPHIIRDLGVIFDEKLTFVPHVEDITNRAYNTLGFIIRSSSCFVKSQTLIDLFSAYIRSRLEYASVVWSPTYKVHILSIETLQRKFLKYLVFREDGSYPPRGFPQVSLLGRFSLQSLENRRMFVSVVFLHKLVTAVLDCSFLLSLLNFRVPRSNSRQQDVFYLPPHHSRAMTSSPLYNMVSSYRTIQDSIDIFHCNFNIIKNRIFNMEHVHSTVL